MTDTPSPPASPDGTDPSMEEILASIRRILNEDEAPATPPPTPPAAPVAEDPASEEEDVLILDETMIVAPPHTAPPHTAPADPEPVAFTPSVADDPFDFDSVPARPQVEPPREIEVRPSNPYADPFEQPSPAPDLLGLEAAAAAASSVGSLVRTLAASRATQVYSGGPTLEDMVRAELRPLLKQWLDAYLPPMVERLVRVEIERVVGRFVP
jgi:cell pole-organizing protein PopZ